MCLSFFPVPVIKNPDQSNLRGKGLTWLTIVGKSRDLVTWHLLGREQWTDASLPVWAFLAVLYSPGPPAQECSQLQLRWVFQHQLILSTQSPHIFSKAITLIQTIPPGCQVDNEYNHHLLYIYFLAIICQNWTKPCGQFPSVRQKFDS